MPNRSRALGPIALALSLLTALPAAAAARAMACQATGETRWFSAELAGVAAIVRVPARVSRPPIVLWHGFGPPADAAALMKALPLDEVPAVKVYVDLPLFGTRAPADPADSVASRQARDYALRLFQPAVLGAADELPAILEALRGQGCLRPGQAIGLFGFSAGGAAVLTALADRKAPIGEAVLVNPAVGLGPAIAALEHATGHPFAWSPQARAVAARSDAVARAGEIARGRPPPALLILQGGDDAVIASDGATALAAALRPAYARRGAARRLRVETLAGLGHDWTSAEARARVGAAVAAWFGPTSRDQSAGA